MIKIEIPFAPSVAKLVTRGTKRVTTRSTRKGEPGDQFRVEDELFRYAPWYKLVDVIPFELGIVRDQFYRLEGFKTPEQFEKVWRDLHRGEFPTMKVHYVHFFVRYP